MSSVRSAQWLAERQRRMDFIAQYPKLDSLALARRMRAEGLYAASTGVRDIASFIDRVRHGDRCGRKKE